MAEFVGRDWVVRVKLSLNSALVLIVGFSNCAKPPLPLVKPAHARNVGPTPGIAWPPRGSFPTRHCFGPRQCLECATRGGEGGYRPPGNGRTTGDRFHGWRNPIQPSSLGTSRPLASSTSTCPAYTHDARSGRLRRALVRQVRTCDALPKGGVTDFVIETMGNVRSWLTRPYSRRMGPMSSSAGGFE